MCIEIYWTTKGAFVTSKGGDTFKFLGFCAYAFGFPLLLTAFLALIDNNDFIGSLIPEDYHPGIGIYSEDATSYYCSVKGESRIPF
jgi:hypothetical protein